MSKRHRVAVAGRRMTLDDVAAVAGVSRITVSRVVRQTKLVKPATRQKVQNAINKLGYRPDPMLSALSAYRSAGQTPADAGTIIFLDCDGTDFSRSVFLGAQLEAKRLGYHTEYQRMPLTRQSQRQLSRICYHRGVRGILLGPSNHVVDLQDWDLASFASVSLGALRHHPQINSVAIDYFQGANEACRILQDRGCKRIGFAVGQEFEARTGNRWMGGYLAGIGQQKPIIFTGSWKTGKGLRQWCLRRKVDGVLSIHQELLLEWPRQKSCFVLLNDYHLDSTPELRSLTCMSLNYGMIGAEGVRVLHYDLIKQNYGIPESSTLTLLHGHWVNL